MDSYSVIDSLLTMHGALVGYQQGMLCFGCQANWENSYVPSTFEMSIHSSTCDAVYTGCAPALNQLNTLVPQELQLYIKILQASTSGKNHTEAIKRLTLLYNAIVAVGLCQVIGNTTDCKAVVCNEMLRGPNIGLSRVPGLIEALMAVVESGSYFPMVDFIEAFLAGELQAPEEAIPYVNVYSTDSNAFMAYDTGCANTLSGYACNSYPMDTSSGSTTNKAIIVVVVIVLVVGAIVGGVYVFLWWIRKQRPSPSLSQVVSADGGAASGAYAPLINGEDN